LKPTRAGVRADDVGAQRPEEACMPRDGGFRGGVHTQHATTQLKNRHERVCGRTKLERSDRRRLAYPEMAVYEGEFRATHNPRWRFTRGSPSQHKERQCAPITTRKTEWTWDSKASMF
jgi:hypothetical protein